MLFFSLKVHYLVFVPKRKDKLGTSKTIREALWMAQITSLICLCSITWGATKRNFVIVTAIIFVAYHTNRNDSCSTTPLHYCHTLRDYIILVTHQNYYTTHKIVRHFTVANILCKLHDGVPLEWKSSSTAFEPYFDSWWILLDTTFNKISGNI